MSAIGGKADMAIAQTLAQIALLLPNTSAAQHYERHDVQHGVVRRRCSA